MCVAHVTLNKLKPEKGQRLHLPVSIRSWHESVTEASFLRGPIAQDVCDHMSDLEQVKLHGLAFALPVTFSNDEDVSTVQAEQGESTSYAVSIFKAFGELQDSNDDDNSLLTRLEKQLWNAEYK